MRPGNREARDGTARYRQLALRLRRWAAPTAMTVLAASSCRESGARPTATATPTDSADQVLFNMSHHILDDGLKRSLVDADTAYLYENTKLAELRHVKVTFFDRNGVESSVVTADSGTYRMQTGSMQARGHVVATTPEGRRLTSASLDYDSKTNQISTDKPFVYDYGDTHAEGNGFTSDPDFKNVVTQQPRGGQRGPAAGATSPTRDSSGKGGKTNRDLRLPGQ
jgi:LPS export ABC transporter protein LptC